MDREEQTVGAPAASDDERWADEQIAAMMETYIARLGPAPGKLEIVQVLAGDLEGSIDLHGGIDAPELARLAARADAVQDEAIRRRERLCGE